METVLQRDESLKLEYDKLIMKRFIAKSTLLDCIKASPTLTGGQRLVLESRIQDILPVDEHTKIRGTEIIDILHSKKRNEVGGGVNYSDLFDEEDYTKLMSVAEKTGGVNTVRILELLLGLGGLAKVVHSRLLPSSDSQDEARKSALINTQKELVAMYTLAVELKKKFVKGSESIALDNLLPDLIRKIKDIEDLKQRSANRVQAYQLLLKLITDSDIKNINVSKQNRDLMARVSKKDKDLSEKNSEIAKLKHELDKYKLPPSNDGIVSESEYKPLDLW